MTLGMTLGNGALYHFGDSITNVGGRGGMILDHTFVYLEKIVALMKTPFIVSKM